LPHLLSTVLSMRDVVASCELGAPPLLRDNVGAADGELDLAIGANSGAQKFQWNYCTICCAIPASGGWLAGSLAIPSS
jgi:hypothetical protein